MLNKQTKNLTPTQLKVYSQLRVGFKIQHLTGRTYGLVDLKGKRKRLAPCVFEALQRAELLTVLDNRASFEIYGANSGIGPSRVNNAKSPCYGCSGDHSCQGCRSRHIKIKTKPGLRGRGKTVMPSKNVSLSHGVPLSLVGEGSANWLEYNRGKVLGQKAVLTVSPQDQKRWLAE